MCLFLVTSDLRISPCTFRVLVPLRLQFDLSSITGAKLKLRSAPNAFGELASARLPTGGRVSFVAEEPSLAAQLFAVAAPSKHAVQVTHRLTALVRDGEAGDDEAGPADREEETPREDVAAPPMAEAAADDAGKKKKRKRDKHASK